MIKAYTHFHPDTEHSVKGEFQLYDSRLGNSALCPVYSARGEEPVRFRVGAELCYFHQATNTVVDAEGVEIALSDLYERIGVKEQ
jgi:hypothetical protein